MGHATSSSGCPGCSSSGPFASFRSWPWRLPWNAFWDCGEARSCLRTWPPACGPWRKGDFDLRHAMRLCRQYPSSLAVVVRAMLAKVGRPLPEVEKALTDACEHEASRLFTNVRVQNLAFNVAPMLGWPAPCAA